MDDKIKEVMDLVREFASESESFPEYASMKEVTLAWDAIESKLREMVQIPPGYALVPVEPTEEMIMSGMEAKKRGAISVWDAMLSAAPTPNTSADALKGL